MGTKINFTLGESTKTVDNYQVNAPEKVVNKAHLDSQLALKQDLVATPVDNEILLTDALGQSKVSGKSFNDSGTTINDIWSANKIIQEVDNAKAGLTPKDAVHVATVTALASVTYDNGTAGVGATLTADANGAIGNIDGFAVSVNDRVLVKNQADAIENGIYIVTDLGSAGTPFILTRVDDFNQTSEMPKGSFCYINHGSTYATQSWILTSNTPITVGVTDINFTQFKGDAQLVAGDGIDITGKDVNVLFDDLTVNLDLSNQLQVKDLGITDVKVSNTANIKTSKIQQLTIVPVNSAFVDADTQDVINNKAQGQISARELLSNKTDDVETNSSSSTLYASTKGVYDFVLKAKPITTSIVINELTPATVSVSLGIVPAGFFVEKFTIAATTVANESITAVIGTAGDDDLLANAVEIEDLSYLDNNNGRQGLYFPTNVDGSNIEFISATELFLKYTTVENSTTCNLQVRIYINRI